MAALKHDIAESYTGDLRAPFKWDCPEIAARVAEAEKTWLAKAGIDMPELNDLEKQILKWCDLLELVAYCCVQYGQGNSFAKAPINKVLPLLSNGAEKYTEHRPAILGRQLATRFGVIV